MLSENSYLLCSIDVRRLAGHEIEERVELDVAGVVGVHNRQDALEVRITLNSNKRPMM